MAVKAHTLFYKRNDGEETNICVQIVHFFVGCNVLVMQRLTDSRVINAVCEPLFSVCTLHLSRVQRLLKNAPTRDASPPLERNALVQKSFTWLQICFLTGQSDR